MASPFPFTSGQVLTAAQLNSIGEWIAFTPSWNNVTIGNATESWYYAVVNEIVFVEGRTNLGSTSSITGLMTFDVPFGTAATEEDIPIGRTYYSGNGVSQVQGFADLSSQTLRWWIYKADTTYVQRASTSATVPWSGPSYDGSVFRFSATYRLS